MPVSTARVDLDAVATLAAYAAHLGITVHEPADDNYPSWDGAALKRPARAADWAHEIAHWLLATPGRRLLVDYGWGQDADFAGYDLDEPDVYGYGDRPDLTVLPWPRIEDVPDGQEEILASLLGFAFLVRVGAVAPYDLYGFLDWRHDDTGFVTKTVEPSVYADRRTVQPHVTDFAAWLARISR